MRSSKVVRKKIGELLIERRIITAAQLDIALEEHRKNGGYLSQHLISLGFATELDIATCLSNQYNFAYLSLKNYDIPKEVLELIPLKWIKIYTFVPVDRVGNVLSIAMADPLNEGVIQMLQQISNCEVVVFISTFSELNEVINKHFGEKLKDLEKHVIDPADLEKIRITVSQFIQTKAYIGIERRQYVRLKKDLGVSFYYHAMTFQGQTRDISYGGVSFIAEDRNYGGMSFFSSIFTPLYTSLACKISLKSDQVINVVINVLRIQVYKSEPAIGSTTLSGQRYEISGMFEFIANEDRETLLSFLKENLL